MLSRLKPGWVAEGKHAAARIVLNVNFAIILFTISEQSALKDTSLWIILVSRVSSSNIIDWFRLIAFHAEATKFSNFSKILQTISNFMVADSRFTSSKSKICCLIITIFQRFQESLPCTCHVTSPAMSLLRQRDVICQGKIFGPILGKFSFQLWCLITSVHLEKYRSDQIIFRKICINWSHSQKASMFVPTSVPTSVQLFTNLLTFRHRH